MSKDTFQAQLGEVQSGLVALLDKIESIHNDILGQTTNIGGDTHAMKRVDLLRLGTCRAVAQDLLSAQEGIGYLSQFGDMVAEMPGDPAAYFSPEELANLGIKKLGPVSQSDV